MEGKQRHLRGIVHRAAYRRLRQPRRVVSSNVSDSIPRHWRKSSAT